MRARTLQLFFVDEGGATAIEYSLLAALVAVALIGTFILFGEAVSNLFGIGPGGAGNVIGIQASKLD